MKLYVMRHGPAEDVAPSGRDFDRALTTAGRARVKQVAELLAKHDEAPKAILASPLARALQTAEIVANVVNLEPAVAVRREIAPSGDMQTLVDELLGVSARRVMLVGHEPDVSALVHAFVPSWDAPLEKAMVVGLRVRANEVPELRFVLEPKTLAWKSS